MLFAPSCLLEFPGWRCAYVQMAFPPVQHIAVILAFFHSLLQFQQALAVPSSHLSKRWRAYACSQEHDLPILHGAIKDVAKMGQVAWDSIDWLQKHPLRTITDPQERLKRKRIEDALKAMFGSRILKRGRGLEYLKGTYVSCENSSISCVTRAFLIQADNTDWVSITVTYRRHAELNEYTDIRLLL